jgi:hypothetical protein
MDTNPASSAGAKCATESRRRPSASAIVCIALVELHAATVKA